MKKNQLITWMATIVISAILTETIRHCVNYVFTKDDGEVTSKHGRKIGFV